MGSRRSRKGNRRCARCGATHKKEELLWLKLRAENPLKDKEHRPRWWSDVGFLFNPKCLKSLPVEASLKYEFPYPEPGVREGWSRLKSQHYFTFYHPLTGEKRLVNLVDVLRSNKVIMLLLEESDAESTS